LRVDGSFKVKEPPAIRGTGYVVESLESALWAFHRAASFREAVLLAANLGHDADTTAGISGMLAGAHHGFDCIPNNWKATLSKQELILGLAYNLYRAIT
jgi:ADP-ribosylglycohydrolase